MPLSFEPTLQSSTFNDLIYAPIFTQLNCTDKNLWSALYGDEIEALKSNIQQGKNFQDIKTKLQELQSMVGRQTLSPVVYSLGLLDLQKFLRSEIKQPEDYLDTIKEVRREWRETLRMQKAFALENFATDVLNAVNYVAKAKWDAQTGREVLAYYYGLIAQPHYQTIVDLVKTLFSEYFTERYDDAGIRVISYCTKEDYQAFKQQLNQLFAIAAQSLAVNKSSVKEEPMIANVPAKSYTEQLWCTAKALGDYIVTHPGHILTMGLATQVVGAAAWQVVRDVSASPTATVTLTPSASISTTPTATVTTSPSLSISPTPSVSISPSNSPGVINTEFRVNTNINGDQVNPCIASLTNGNFVVAWASYASYEQGGSFNGIYGQLFAVNGVPIGAEFQINTYSSNHSYSSGDQSNPSIAGLTNGNFVVAWQNNGQDSSGWGIYGQLFASNGSPIGTEFRVNTITINSQEYPSIAGLANGRFVVTWLSDDGSNYGVFGQLFASDGSHIGTEFRVNTYTFSYQTASNVASLANDNFIVTWTDNNQDGSGSGIYGQLFANNGSFIGTEFRVNTYVNYNQVLSTAGSLADGNFVVSWRSDGQSIGNNDVYGQLFASNSTKIGAEFRVNTYTANYQGDASTAGLINGNFAVVWGSISQDGSGTGIYGQLFASSGIPLGAEFRLNNYTLGDQNYPSITGLTNGNFVVTWQSKDQDGSGWGIYGRIMNISLWASPSVTTTPSITPTTSPNCAITVCPSASSTPSITPSRSPSRSPMPNVNAGAIQVANSGANPAIANFNDDGFIITWQNSSGILGQLFDNSSNKVGTNFLVNTYINGSQINPAVASFATGNFIIVWESNNQDGSEVGIYGQLFDRLTNKMGAEFLVNTYTNSTQSNPAVTTFSDDKFVVVWQSRYQDGSEWGIYGQLFDDSCNKIGIEFPINTYINSSQKLPALASFSSGDFVVVWLSDSQDTSGVWSVYGQRFNQTAGKIGTEFRVDTYCDSPITNPFQPAVITLNNDNFVVSLKLTNVIYYNRNGFCHQLFSSEAEYLSYPLVFTYEGDSMSHTFGIPVAANLNNGNFVLVFQYEFYQSHIIHGHSINSLYYQQFNSSGEPVSTSAQCFAYGVDDGTPLLDQAVTGLSNGKFVSVWSYKGVYSKLSGSNCQTGFICDRGYPFGFYGFAPITTIAPSTIPSRSVSPSITQSPITSPSVTPSHSRNPSVTPTPSSSTTAISSAILSPTPSSSIIPTVSRSPSTTPTTIASTDHAKSSMSILDAFLKVSLPTTIGATLLLIMGWKIRNYLKEKHNENGQTQASNRNSFFADKGSHQEEEASSRSMGSMGIAEGSDSEDEKHGVLKLIRGSKH